MTYTFKFKDLQVEGLYSGVLAFWSRYSQVGLLLFLLLISKADDIHPKPALCNDHEGPLLCYAV